MTLSERCMGRLDAFAHLPWCSGRPNKALHCPACTPGLTVQRISRSNPAAAFLSPLPACQATQLLWQTLVFPTFSEQTRGQASWGITWPVPAHLSCLREHLVPAQMTASLQWAAALFPVAGPLDVNTRSLSNPFLLVV